MGTSKAGSGGSVGFGARGVAVMRGLPLGRGQRRPGRGCRPSDASPQRRRTDHTGGSLSEPAVTTVGDLLPFSSWKGRGEGFGGGSRLTSGAHVRGPVAGEGNWSLVGGARGRAGGGCTTRGETDMNGRPCGRCGGRPATVRRSRTGGGLCCVVGTQAPGELRWSHPGPSHFTSRHPRDDAAATAGRGGGGGGGDGGGGPGVVGERLGARGLWATPAKFGEGG